MKVGALPDLFGPQVTKNPPFYLAPPFFVHTDSSGPIHMADVLSLAVESRPKQ